jgi:hypothetical protein
MYSLQIIYLILLTQLSNQVFGQGPSGFVLQDFVSPNQIAYESDQDQCNVELSIVVGISNCITLTYYSAQLEYTDTLGNILFANSLNTITYNGPSQLTTTLSFPVQYSSIKYGNVISASVSASATKALAVVGLPWTQLPLVITSTTTLTMMITTTVDDTTSKSKICSHQSICR